jgi:hypothetical protein
MNTVRNIVTVWLNFTLQREESAADSLYNLNPPNYTDDFEQCGRKGGT